MDRQTYEQLDRMEHKINKCIEGLGMIMTRMDEVDEEYEEQEEKTKESVINPPKREKKVNPDDEYRQE